MKSNYKYSILLIFFFCNTILAREPQKVTMISKEQFEKNQKDALINSGLKEKMLKTSLDDFQKINSDHSKNFCFNNFNPVDTANKLTAFCKNFREEYPQALEAQKYQGRYLVGCERRGKMWGVSSSAKAECQKRRSGLLEEQIDCPSTHCAGKNPPDFIYKSYAGCPASLDWRKKFAESVCTKNGLGGGVALNWKNNLQKSKPDINLPERLVFFYDGFAEFSPIDGVRFGAKNIPPTHEGTGNANGIKGGLIYNDIITPEQKEKTDLFYGAGSGFDGTYNNLTTFSCLLKMKDELEILVDQLQFSKPKINVGGFSNGGAAALEFAYLAGQNNIEINYLVLIDPIPRVGGYIAESIFSNYTMYPVGPNVKESICFYQDFDTDSFPLLNLHGRKIVGGPSVYLYKSDYIESNRDPAYAHLDIFGIPKVQAAIAKLYQ
jgi:hypothetical protein